MVRSLVTVKRPPDDGGIMQQRRWQASGRVSVVLRMTKNSASGVQFARVRTIAIEDARALPWVLEKIEACLAEIDGTVVLLDE